MVVDGCLHSEPAGMDALPAVSQLQLHRLRSRVGEALHASVSS